MPHTEQLYWIALSELLGPRARAAKPLLQHFKHPKAIFEADATALRDALPDLPEEVLARLTSPDLEWAARIADQCAALGIDILTPDAPDFPAGLLALQEPPTVLYCMGKLPETKGRMTVGIVGARRCSAYGERCTYKMSYELASAGAVIVSGMAEGIDAVAAAAALEAGGQTVAFLGCGLDVDYPKQNAQLRQRILERGAICSEYPPGTRPFGAHFPVRNRLISGLSDAVLVTEAAERSGSLITARYAVAQGKALFVLPGDIDKPRSAGTNQLLQGGATPALCSDDVLEHFRFLQGFEIDELAARRAAVSSDITAAVMRGFGLPFVGERRLLAPRGEEPAPKKGKRRKKGKAEKEGVAKTTPAPDLGILDPRSRELYLLLPDTAFSLDAMVAGGVRAAEASATLTMLEIYGLISSRPGGLYIKK